MTAIIFGASGQDGHYLKMLLQKELCNVITVSRSGDHDKTDITDFHSVAQLISKHKPAFIFHLAANSTTKHEAALENHSIISTGTINILEAVKLHSPLSRVFISGSGLQFKNDGKPIKETDPFEARDAYSVSRIHSVYAARYYRSIGIKAYVGYFFNHDSPLRTERHMTKKIAEAAKRIAAGSNEKLEIGDTSVVKEYGFAGDIVEAVWTLVRQEKFFEATIGTGVGYSIQDWLSACFGSTGKNWKDHVIGRNDFVAEYRQLVSDTRLINSLGWKPGVDF